MSRAPSAFVIRRLLGVLALWAAVLTVRAEAAPRVTGGCPSVRAAGLIEKPGLLQSAITYCDGGDLFTGAVAIEFEASAVDSLDFFVAGYPDGKQVRIVLSDATGRTAPVATTGSGESWRPLRVTIPAAWREASALRLTLIDESTTWTGWGGLGYAQRASAFAQVPDVLRFFGKACGILLLLMTPGLFWNAVAARRLPTALMPVAGVVALAAAGLAFWILPVSLHKGARLVTLVAFALALATAFHRIVRDRASARRGFEASRSASRDALAIAALVFLQAVAIGINPLPIDQESSVSTTMPGRMIASPPDHLIPYQTADYLAHRYDGIEHDRDYFGDWNITSRGPLVPLGINGLFHIFRVAADGVTDDRSSWPLAKHGEDLARIYGWALNALVILGAFQLLRSLGIEGRAQRVALAWLALAPVVAINTTFLWPKLLATYFVLLAVDATIRRRPGSAGMMAAMACLSHPVGALMIPSLLAFSTWLAWRAADEGRRLRESLPTLGTFTVALLATMLPWLVYKAHLGYADPFVRYIAGDGQGLAPAASLATWWAARGSNLYLTLVPGAFFFSGHMDRWLDGPLGESSRWAVQYAKTLPGNLGLSAFLFACAAFLGRSRSAVVAAGRWALLASALLVMLIFWGFSSDGLGRNCLEPLSVLVVIFAAATRRPSWRWLSPLLPLVALESQWVGWCGFIEARGFALADVPPSAWLCIVAGLAASLAILKLALRADDSVSDSGLRHSRAGRASGATVIAP